MDYCNIGLLIIIPPPLYSTKDPDVKNSDVHVKNKFKWAWLDESVEYIDDQKITQTVLLSDTIKKMCYVVILAINLDFLLCLNLSQLFGNS